MDGTATDNERLDMSDLCRFVAEASPMPMAAVEGSNYIVRYVNPAFCRIIGKREEELIGNEFSGVIPAGAECRPLFDRVYRTGQPETHTGEEHSPSHPFCWSYAMWPVLSADDSPVGIVIQVTETTPTHRSAATMNQALMLGSVRQHEITALTADIGMALAQIVDWREALGRCAEAFIVHLDAALARIWTFDAANNVLELQASAGMYTRLDGSDTPVVLCGWKIGLIVQERQAHLTNDMVNDPRVSDHEWAEREGMVAFAGYPLIVEDRLVGVMAMFARHRMEQETMDALGSVANAIAVGIERKRAEEALVDSEERLRTLVASSPLAIIVVDPDTTVRLWNAAAEKLFGWTEAEVLGQRAPFIPEGRLPECASSRITALQGDIFAVETQRNRRDGSLVDVSLTAAPLRDSAGEITQILVLIEDITERKQAEAAARESSERVRFMAESMPQKIFTAKPDGAVDYFNQQWTEFTGLALDIIKDWGWTQFVHPDDLEEYTPLWRHSIATGELFQCMHRFRRADGVYRWHLTRAHAMRDADGKISMWIGSSTDIHEEKEKEEELRRANENLNQFAFAASHDLQEPLRMITAFSQLLTMRYGGPLDEEAAKCVGYITEGTKRMSELLTDLLSYTRAGADSEESAGMIEFNEVFDEATRNLQTAITDSCAVVTRGPLPVVHGHGTHFLQILQNLIGNALKYHAARSPRVHVSAEKRNGEWRFAVADNGIGIAPEYQKQIFGVFKRLHGKAIPGTGIGLAICQRLVERYGGRIWVESQPDQGATFYFTLPRGTSRPKAARGTERPQARSHTTA